MSGIYGYGEDALTLWALKHHLPKLLKEYRDQTVQRSAWFSIVLASGEPEEKTAQIRRV